uniref:FXYD domain-containing ion transport regulator n=1 Tax=Steinernema glaseri TaxID=37863 RepID=A0A1I8ACA5_9BILA
MPFPSLCPQDLQAFGEMEPRPQQTPCIVCSRRNDSATTKKVRKGCTAVFEEGWSVRPTGQAMIPCATVLLLLCVGASTPLPEAHSRISHSGQNLEEPENALKEFLGAINPVYVVALGLFILAGCVFEVMYGTRGSSSRTTRAHVASRQAPYSA